MSSFIVVFGFVCSIHVVTSFLPGYMREFEYIANEIRESVGTFDKSKVKTKWLEQPLDHFDPHVDLTWKMRYFKRTNLWKKGKPIYLCLGGEGAASPDFLKTGTVVELAEETNGALFMTEHRYYGKSKPFKYLTSENLQFLSSMQALADIANLLRHIKSSPRYKASKVVVVGGSYAGNLAAWMRLIYPDLVDAAIASSAPVLAKLDFYEYLETVSENFKLYGSPGCWDRIAEKFAHYEKAFQTKEGTEALKKEENICDTCDMTQQLNQEEFFSNKAGKFMDISQYARSTSEFTEYCDSNFSLTFRKMTQIGLNRHDKSKCFDYNYDNVIEDLRTDYENVAWTYQTCTEFSYFQTGSSGEQPFTKRISIDYYYNTCERLFGSDFNEARVKKGVEETNIRFSGLKPNVTKVVFVNGDWDPWSKLSILEDLSYETQAERISQSSHCQDLYSNRDGDSEELKDARTYIKYLVKSWIGEDDYYKEPFVTLV